MGLFDIFKKKSSEEEDAYEGYDNVEVDDDEYEYEGESLSVYDAAQIWASNGKDEDYTFGYSEEELEDAL